MNTPYLNVPNAYQNDLKCLNSASLHHIIMNEHTCTTLLQKAASSVRTTHLTQSRGIQRRTVLSKLFSQKKPGHSSPVPCSSKVVRDAANGTRIEFNGVSRNAGEYKFKSTTIFYNTFIYIYCIYNIHVYVYTSIAFYCIHLLISIDPERRSSIKAAMREFPNTPFESFKKHLSSLHLRCKTLLRVT